MLKNLESIILPWANLIVAISYVIAFYIAYVYFLNFHFSYLGYDILPGRDQKDFSLILTFILSILPMLLYRGVIGISSFLCIFIYFLLYVPIIITYHFSIDGSKLYIFYQQSLFVLGMTLLFVADRIQLRNAFSLKVDKNLFPVILVVTILCTLYLMILYRKNLRIVSFSDVYDLRSENSKLGGDVITGYLSAWLVNVFIPLNFGYALFSKKWTYYLIGTFSCVIVYMATGAKTAVVFPIASYLVYKLFTKVNLKYAFFNFGLFLSSVTAILTIMEFNIISSLLLMRTIGNGGDLTRHYHDFFLTHPHTYFSHVNIINALTQMYPYDDTLGVTIGAYYWGETNVNANFWATDGYAAVGSFGVLLASLIMFFVFLIFNNISKSYNKVFLIVVLIPYLTMFLNASIFQSLLTGGAIFTFLFLSFSSNKKNKHIL